jgi:hypothetical protein
MFICEKCLHDPVFYRIPIQDAICPFCNNLTVCVDLDLEDDDEDEDEDIY